MLWVVYTDNEHLYTDCKSQSEKRDVFYLRIKQALLPARMWYDRKRIHGQLVEKASLRRGFGGFHFDNALLPLAS